jgi:CRP/FNR family transcriptional regulator, cyclic AMP receptor protein
MNEQSLWYLENIDVTGIFCPQKMGGMDESHTKKVFKRGDYIYLPDESSDKMYLITEGRIKIGNYADSGKEITKAILTNGEVFGELSLVGEDKRRDFAIAMEDTTVCMISVTEMKGLMKEHSALNLFIMKIMGSRVLQMEQRLESLVFKDSRSRIIEFIKDLATRKGQRVGYEMLIRQFFTHQEIANLTATSRQTVTTVLNDLRNKNILTFNRKRLLVRDMEKLGQEMSVQSQ